jgi:hypothetical protein
MRDCAIVFSLIGLLFCGCRPAHDQEAFKRQLSTLVAPQSDVSRVVDCLDTHKIAHSRYDPATKSISALFRSDELGLMVRTDFKVVFSFDRYNRLTTEQIMPEFTGP